MNREEFTNFLNNVDNKNTKTKQTDSDINYKQNYENHNTIITKNGKIILNQNQDIPTDFETLLDFVSYSKKDLVQILDNNTITIKIDKNKIFNFTQNFVKRFCGYIYRQ